MIQLIHGDCLEEMRGLPDNSVDMILADLPYGTTACKWDTVIPLEPLWREYKRLIKHKGAIVLTASQPFTTTLISSNREWFKYCWVWDKGLCSNMLNAPYQPLKVHEDICVFSHAASTYSPRGPMHYYPQMWEGTPYRRIKPQRMVKQIYRSTIHDMGNDNPSGERYPTSIIQGISNTARTGEHPTQKPAALMEYLIRTYTNEGETVMDNTMGSGTTGIACLNTGRHFIGIEKDAVYFELAKKRINELASQPQLEAVKP